MRSEYQLYPDYRAEIAEIEKHGISEQILQKIIDKHIFNIEYNKKLYKRYMALDGEVPITRREPRFHYEKVDGKEPKLINNKINNDFFGEINDFTIGYFAGKAFAYSYSKTEESEEDTGGLEAIKEAKKVLSDFVTMNNMFDVEMETTKHASVYGYAGRLMYHDKDGLERVMVIPGFESIILSNTSIMEPQYAIRLFETEDIKGRQYWTVEFYDDTLIRTYEGQFGGLKLTKTEKNLYGYCPLFGVPFNNEMLGNAEKVLEEIDAYDRTVSDSSNQIEGQVHSKEVYENVNITQEEIDRSNYTGAVAFHNGAGNGKIYKLESNINDNFVEHHLQRLEENIYRFSKTPNLSDQAFGNATGVALKFKLTAIETKCGMFQAKMMSAGTYMFKLLASSFKRRKVVSEFDPLQCYIDYKRNFPLDIEGEARAAQALINAGIPEEIAYGIALSCVDDIDYVMQVKERIKNSLPSLEDAVMDDFGIEDEDKDIDVPPTEKEDEKEEENEE